MWKTFSGCAKVYLYNVLEVFRRLKPTFTYKDVGIRFLTKKPRLLKRRMVSY